MPEIAVILAFTIQQGEDVDTAFAALPGQVAKHIESGQIGSSHTILAALKIIETTTTNDRLKELVIALGDLLVVDEGENAIDDFKQIIGMIGDLAKTAKEARNAAKG